MVASPSSAKAGVDPMSHLVSSVAIAALLAAALHDLAARTIPNRISLGIALLGAAVHLAAGDLGLALVAATVVFLLAAVAWRFGAMGGGDVKLLGACALLLPPEAVPAMVLTIALAGGGLGLVYLALRWWPPAPRPALPRSAALPRRALRAELWRIRRGGPLPYAVAIALGASLSLLA